MASLCLQACPAGAIVLSAVRRLWTLSVSGRWSGGAFFFGCGGADVTTYTTPRMWMAPCCPRPVLHAVPVHPCWLLRPPRLTRVSPLPGVMLVPGTGDTVMDRLGRHKGHVKIAPACLGPLCGRRGDRHHLFPRFSQESDASHCTGSRPLPHRRGRLFCMGVSAHWRVAPGRAV